MLTVCCDSKRGAHEFCRYGLPAEAAMPPEYEEASRLDGGLHDEQTAEEQAAEQPLTTVPPDEFHGEDTTPSL